MTIAENLSKFKVFICQSTFLWAEALQYTLLNNICFKVE